MKKSDALQVSKFLLVGALNTLIDYGVFYILLSLFSVDKNAAQVVATILAMTNSFLVNRYWTFKKKNKIVPGEIMRFIVVNFLSLGTTLLCLNLFYDVCRLHLVAGNLFSSFLSPSFWEGDTGVLFCKILAMPFSLGVNFLGNRFWVFAEKHQK